MMKEKELKKLAEEILANEKIIEDQNALDKVVKSAKEKIEIIMNSLSLEDILALDNYIMENKYLTK